MPLAAAHTGIYGALYCLADVQTEFSEVAKQLKEVAELLGQGLNRQLHGALLPEYLVSSSRGGLEAHGFHAASSIHSVAADAVFFCQLGVRPGVQLCGCLHYERLTPWGCPPVVLRAAGHPADEP